MDKFEETISKLKEKNKFFENSLIQENEKVLIKTVYQPLVVHPLHFLIYF